MQNKSELYFYDDFSQVLREKKTIIGRKSLWLLSIFLHKIHDHFKEELIVNIGTWDKKKD